MDVSAPLYRLKRRAKRLSREGGIPLHAALDRIAREEGVARWSLLAARLREDSPARPVHDRLSPGTLVLLAARPGHGKTLLAIELAFEAVRAGNEAVFFSLEYTATDFLARIDAMGIDRAAFGERLAFDDSDDIAADHIAGRLADAAPGTLAVIDYLQLLDQKRVHPDLTTQVRTLRDFARRKGIVLAFIAQIDRAFEASGRAVPGYGDIRLPNPLDLSLFDAACFLHDGEVRWEAA